jgi:hypothetical protein
MDCTASKVYGSKYNDNHSSYTRDFAEAFGRRAYLVKVSCERGEFVFSIKHNEASCELEAARVAKDRLTRAVRESECEKFVGEVTGVVVRSDSESQRATFGIKNSADKTVLPNRWYAA